MTSPDHTIGQRPSDAARERLAAPPNEPFVSVIVPVLNDRRIVQTLDALSRQTYPPDRFEVIVCENGSAPALDEIIRNHSGGLDVRLVREPRRGSYRARNAGLAAARGTVLAFTDADCLPARDWLSRGIEALTASQFRSLIAGRIDVFPQSRRPTGYEICEMLHAFPQREYVERMGFGATANLFAARCVIDTVRGFRADLLSGGDVDFCERAALAGFGVTYRDDVIIHHPARRSLGEVRRKLRRTNRGAYLERDRFPPLLMIVRGLFPPLRSMTASLVEPRVDIILRPRYARALFAIHYTNEYERIRNCASVLLARRRHSRRGRRSTIDPSCA